LAKTGWTIPDFLRALGKGASEQAKVIPGAPIIIGYLESYIQTMEKVEEGQRHVIARELRLMRFEEIEKALKDAGMEQAQLRHDLTTLIQKGLIDVWEELYKHGKRLDILKEMIHRLQDQRRFPEASKILTRLPSLHNIPYTRNVYFTGRNDLLDQIRKMLSGGDGSSKAAVLTQVIAGLGGVGKTQTALEYAYRYGTWYNAVLWVSGENLETDFASLSRILSLPEQENPNLKEKVIPAVKRWFDSHTSWLLIFDNAENPESIEPFIPKAGGGHSLITSRNQDWGLIARAVELPVMTPDEAFAFLIERTGCEGEAEKEKEKIRELAGELGYLPLALEQAGSYIAQSGCGFSEYLKLYQSKRKQMMRRGKPDQYKGTVATTWQISFQSAKKLCGDAAEILYLCSFLAPDNIPIKLVKLYRDFSEEGLQDDLKINDAISSLKKYSLISRDGDFLSIHRLVQAVTRDETGEGDKKSWAGAALNLVNEAFPQDSHDFRTWEECRILVPHAEAVLGFAEELKICEEPDYVQESGRLMNQTGLYYEFRGFYYKAEPLFRRAVEIGEKTLGKDHPVVSTRLNNFANLLRETGRYEEAEPLYRRAIDIGEKTLGKDHPTVAIRINNLANLLSETGRYEDAEPLFRRAIEIDEKILGKDHPDLAIDLNNLANLLSDTGRYEDAEPLYRRALSIDEKILGSNHPDVATDLHNLGRLLHDTGREKEGIELLLRAYQIMVKSLGPDHPTTRLIYKSLLSWGRPPEK